MKIGTKKILVMDNFVHENYGGGQVFSNWFYDRLRRLDGFEVVKLDLDSIKNVPVNRSVLTPLKNWLDTNSMRNANKLFQATNKVLSKSIETIRLMLQARLLKGVYFDVIISNDFRDLWIIDKATISMEKLVIVLHNPNLKRYLIPKSKSSFLEKIFNTTYYLYKYSKLSITTLVAINKTQLDIVNKYLSKQAIEISNGIDTQKYNTSDRISQNKIAIFTGRLFEEQKHISELIHIFFEVSKPDWIFFLIGTGPDMKYYNGLIRSMGLEHRVILTNFLPEREKIDMMRRGKVFLSASRDEGLPFSYLEAMSCGLPLLTYRNDGAEAIISDGINGFIVDGVESFKKRLIEIMEDDELQRHLSLNARKTIVENFDQEETFKRYLSIILG